jgi:hypothetical protein
MLQELGPDPYLLAQSLRSVSEPFRETNAKAFDNDFVRHVGPLMDVPEGQALDLAGILSISMELLRDSGYRLDPQVSLATKALTQSSEFMRVLYPSGHSGEFSATHPPPSGADHLRGGTGGGGGIDCGPGLGRRSARGRRPSAAPHAGTNERIVFGGSFALDLPFWSRRTSAGPGREGVVWERAV